MIKAVLGPTNTGKTHYAVERMLGYNTGMMGFPLRLLAREVYDRVVAAKGAASVALLTGEEKIMPPQARYYLCTAEAMPRHMQLDFVAIDEIQMASDPERGHVFTDHLLHTRGRFETLFLGADTMRGPIRALVEDVEIVTRPRLSALLYREPVRLARLPRRSAIVAFSVSDVYSMAELVKRNRGGTAIVMGALSPRTRNAQVAMYQSGEVDYLVATDAVGMGLNMDIQHVAFAGLHKFDGMQYRSLTAAEAAQVAGRAGRHTQDGTFSTLYGADMMDAEMVERICDHNFNPVRKLIWRSRRLDFSTLERLVRSLETRTDNPALHRLRDATDLVALKGLAQDEDIRRVAQHKDKVALLWDVAQVPDFRKISEGDHQAILKRLYLDLTSKSGKVDEDFMAAQVNRLDNINGDIDTLAGRIASIRVWTYISHRSGWLGDSEHWAQATRTVEDKLSDALHDRLTQRFVDRRTAVLMRALKHRGRLSVSIDDATQTVSVEGHDIGELKGFSFKADAEIGTSIDDRATLKTLNSAAQSALAGEILRRAKLFANVGVKTLEIDCSRGLNKPVLAWEGVPFARIEKSGGMLALKVVLLDSTLLEGEAADLVLAKSQDWLDTRIAEKLDPLLKLSRELNGEAEAPEGTQPLSGVVRGVAYRLLENYGVMPRAAVAGELRQVDQEQRGALRRFGIRIGATSLYIPFILKPHATELRAMMWALEAEREGLPASLPTPGMVWAEMADGADRAFYTLAGFVAAGSKAIRMDMLERLADAVRPMGQNGSWFDVTPEIMGLVGLSGDDFAAVMKTIGYRHEVREIDAATLAAEAAAAADSTAAEDKADVAAPEVSAEAPAGAEASVAEVAAVEAEPVGAGEGAGDKEVELVQRYVFQWAPRKPRAPKRGAPRREGDAETGRQADQQNRGRKGGKGAGKGAEKGPRRGGQGAGKDGARDGGKPRGFEARPQRSKQADPDSPFAALAGLKSQLNKKS